MPPALGERVIDVGQLQSPKQTAPHTTDREYALGVGQGLPDQPAVAPLARHQGEECDPAADHNPQQCDEEQRRSTDHMRRS